MARDLAIIAGPTASGKSKLAVALAHRLDGEVISADSMQVYRGMDIGSAKIREEEKEGVPHHLIDILLPTEDFNVSIFCDRARSALAEIRERGHFPIICGGTGFYIQALLYGIDFAEGETDRDLRGSLEAEAERKGTQYMEEKLALFDPVSAASYHGNRKRIIRAIEYHELTGLLLSEKNEEERSREPICNAAYFVLDMPRDVLYKRIDERVDLMMEEGLLGEVKRLRKEGVNREMTSMQGLGYRQLYDHLEGRYDLETAISEIKKQTRHFAKRQLTWYRREKDVIWVDVMQYAAESDPTEKTAEYMEQVINGRI